VNLRLDYVGDCRPLGSSHISVANSGPWTIQPDRTFAIDDNDADSSRLRLNGSFTGDAASGTFDLHTTIEAGARHVECDTGTVSWNAKLQ